MVKREERACEPQPRARGASGASPAVASREWHSRERKADLVGIRDAVAAVADPELRVITIEELGILRDVTVDDVTRRVVVTITPTYSGCPAMDVIQADIRRALRSVGHPDAEVRIALHPPWSTDDISPAGRDKLAAAGIAPPGPARRGGLPNRVSLALTLRCPRCGSPETEEISRFGSTSCKAIWRCRSCAEPFDHVKAL